MRYQVGFGILQAGHYGVAQTRRRCILLASAPGYKLPKFPEPTHVFDYKGCESSKVKIDGIEYTNSLRWTESAPFPTITIKDAISDLPPIRNGDQNNQMKYDGPKTYFQQMMRKGCAKPNVMIDHICKPLSALNEKRIMCIPITPGSDWRDLPNKKVKLSNGEWAQELKYEYMDFEKGLHPYTKTKTGVCHCLEKPSAKCSNPENQDDTLIPWWMPHTGNTNNNYSGVYGRLAWDGFFPTTTTDPEPSRKAGRSLHPDQHRVVSVRECARSQGFPDHWTFCGNLMEKHRQIGNAVAPPMGKAIGLEISKALSQSTIGETSLKRKIQEDSMKSKIN